MGGPSCATSPRSPLNRDAALHGYIRGPHGGHSCFKTVEIDLNGRVITIETGKIAKQANGAVVVRSGDSVVLVTACSNEEPKANASFFPLTVDYREYTYAAGRFPGGFIKREGRAVGERDSHQPSD